MSSESDRETLNDSSTNNEEKLSIVEQPEETVDDGVAEMANEEKISNGLPEAESDGNELTDPSPPLLEQSVVLQGKRSRKPTSRLDISQSTSTKKEFIIPQGRGKPLGEIECVNYRITHASTDALSRLRHICFGRRGVKASVKKNLREFKGFEFSQDSDEYRKHLSQLTKLKKDQLRSMSDILCLPSTGRNAEHAERILDFLIEPVDDGRRKSAKRAPKKRRTVSKGSANTDDDTTKQKAPKNNVDDHSESKTDDYNYRPGKGSPKKRKRSHSIVSDSDEEKKENEQSPTDSDVSDQKDLLEGPTVNEAAMETSIADVV